MITKILILQRYLIFMDADKRAISVVVKPNAPKTRLISIDDHGVHHIAQRREFDDQDFQR